MTGAGEVPLLIVVSDRHRFADVRAFLDALRSCVDAGLPALWFRDRDLRHDMRRNLAHRVAEVVAGSDTELIVSLDPELAAELGAGLHLPAGEAARCTGAVAGGGVTRASRSCHGRDEVEAAANEGCRFATMSPVFPTASKPGVPALGLVSLAGPFTIPVVALGGVTPANAGDCISAGAAGVAVCGAVLDACDPGDAVIQLMETIR